MQVYMGLLYLKNNMEKLISLCKDINCDYLENVSLSNYTTFKVGGNCSVMCFPNTFDQLTTVFDYVTLNNLNYFILGKGSNVLFKDNGFNGAIINTTKFDEIILQDENTIFCTAGTSLMRLCKFALENGLSGLEFAYGIPGTVGGAVYMNAGAYGGEIKDVLINATHISKSNEIITKNNENLDFKYRHSYYCDSDDLIVSALFKLSKAESESIKEKMDDFLQRRKLKQPLEYPSAGSTFKRPDGHFAGALIEQCELKGFSVGGAQVSEKHCGFIINKDNATAQNVIDLIKHCQKVVLEQKGVVLETEIKIV